MTPARLVIADDHPLVRRAVSRLLEEDPDIEIVNEVGDFEALFESVRQDRPDLVLMDVKMPGGDGLEAVRRLNKRHPELPVLVLSGLPEEEFVLRLVRAGAAGYVEKQSSPEVIKEAVRTVLQGGIHVGAAGSRILARAAGPTGAGQDHDELSARELQVLRLIGEGYKVGEIASELGLSPKSVSTYRTRILKKMGLESTADLIRYAIRHHLAE